MNSNNRQSIVVDDISAHKVICVCFNNHNNSLGQTKLLDDSDWFDVPYLCFATFNSTRHWIFQSSISLIFLIFNVFSLTAYVLCLTTYGIDCHSKGLKLNTLFLISDGKLYYCLGLNFWTLTILIKCHSIWDSFFALIDTQRTTNYDKSMHNVLYVVLKINHMIIHLYTSVNEYTRHMANFPFVENCLRFNDVEILYSENAFNSIGKETHRLSQMILSNNIIDNK